MKFIGSADEGSLFQKWFWGLAGILFVLAIWIGLTAGAEPVVTSGILPSPWRVLNSYGELFSSNELLRNMGLSIGLNLAGYIEAVALCLPIGFFIGLFKYPRWGFQRQVDAIRYVPLTALTGLFIVWFGIETPMKIHFLAFGILIYLLPVMVQRIDEVDDVYLKTVHTLGASDWQVIRTVYFPSVISRLSDDIRVLTAISWTYIIVAEGTGSQGGIGDLIWKAGLRQGRVDKVFALLIIIMLIGVIQDKLFVWLDRQLFPYKYQASVSIKASRIREQGFFQAISQFGMNVLGWVVLGVYFVLFIQEFVPVFGAFKPLTYIFGNTVGFIHFVFWVIVGLRLWNIFKLRNDQIALSKVTSKTKTA